MPPDNALETERLAESERLADSGLPEVLANDGDRDANILVIIGKAYR